MTFCPVLHSYYVRSTGSPTIMHANLFFLCGWDRYESDKMWAGAGQTKKSFLREWNRLLREWHLKIHPSSTFWNKHQSLPLVVAECVEMFKLSLGPSIMPWITSRIWKTAPPLSYPPLWLITVTKTHKRRRIPLYDDKLFPPTFLRWLSEQV